MSALTSFGRDPGADPRIRRFMQIVNRLFIGGDLAVGADGSISIAANAVTDAKLRDSAGVSVIGRSANSTGDPADIVAAADDRLLTRTGSALGWTQLTVGMFPSNIVGNAQFRQGVARSVVGVTGNATANVADIQGAANQVLVVNSAGTALAFGQVNLAAAAAVTGQLALGNGGTGVNAASTTALFNALDPLTTKGDIVTHNGTDSIRLAVGSDGQVLTADAASAGGVKWAAAGGGAGQPSIASRIWMGG